MSQLCLKMPVYLENFIIDLIIFRILKNHFNCIYIYYISYIF